MGVKLSENGVWWIDENNNKWNIDDFSKENAEFCSNTLHNCQHCVDSWNLVDCVSCTKCDNCTSCDNCLKSSYLTECSDCIDCAELVNCRHCFRCQCRRNVEKARHLY